VIGVSLLLCSLYLRLTREISQIAKAALTILLGTLFFMLEPAFQELDYTSWPEAIANYFTKSNGSVFKLVPWTGYMFFGLGLGIMSKRIISRRKFFISIGVVFISLGYVMGIFTTEAYFWGLKIDLFSYRFIWLGWVLVVLALSLFVYHSYGKIKFLTWMGKNTFILYFLHEVFLFGALTGIGLAKVFNESLSWFESMLLAIFTILIVTLSTVMLKRFYINLITK
jgi:fucose 4-O-acetylase-like acetyltransferase